MINNYFFQKRFFVLILFLTSCFFAKAQSDYTVNPIPHQVYTATAQIQYTNDDKYSDIIPLTFDFTFFGNTYNQVVVGTNGEIVFNTSLANGVSPWSYNTTIPNAAFPVKNAVLGCYNDMNSMPVGNTPGSISYSVVGSAPYRKFVVLFNNQPAFQCGLAAITTFQMILYETLNTVDVQIVQRQPCVTWQSGRAVTGLINDTGLIGITPEGRNTGPWTATQEGWRFALPANTATYNYTACENTSAGFADFNLQVVKNDLDNANLNFYSTLTDAQLAQNAFSALNFTNTTAHHQLIYASDGTTITQVDLRTINCANDFDLDSVATIDEDLNNDGNFANDDTDADGIPNFIDNDDDGDMILTSIEYVFPNAAEGRTSSLLDTDNDGIPNYLDNDDDGDGVLTIDEDYNGNNNPGDDDTNNNGTPDYLEQSVALGVTANVLNNLVSVYPNPASDVFYITNKSDEIISNIAIYSINGSLIKEIKNPADANGIQVADLQTGVYFVRLTTEKNIINCKLIKK
jgi:hypothetical protein